MKICPVCGIKYKDEVEFCPRCHAQLRDVSETDRPRPDLKRLFISIGAVLLFIGFIYLVYHMLISLL